MPSMSAALGASRRVNSMLSHVVQLDTKAAIAAAASNHGQRIYSHRSMNTSARAYSVTGRRSSGRSVKPAVR